MARKKNEVRNEHKRQSILLAAIPLFAANGFSQTTMTSVARNAGISHAAVFLHFPSKENLFQTCVLEPAQEADRYYSLVIDGDGSVWEKIVRLVHGQVHSYLEQESYLQLTQYVMGQSSRFPDLAEHLKQIAVKIVERLMVLIRKGQADGELLPGNAEAMAWAYLSFLHGIGLFRFDPASPFAENLVQIGLR